MRLILNTLKHIKKLDMGQNYINPIPGGFFWSSERWGGAFWPAGMKMPIKPL